PAQQAHCLQAETNQPRSVGQVFQVERALVSPEHPGFGFLLNAEALTGMNGPEPQAQAVVEQLILIFRYANPCGHAVIPDAERNLISGSCLNYGCCLG